LYLEDRHLRLLDDDKCEVGDEECYREDYYSYTEEAGEEVEEVAP